MNVVSTLTISTCGPVSEPKAESALGDEGPAAVPMDQLEPRPHVEAEASEERESVRTRVRVSMVDIFALITKLYWDEIAFWLGEGKRLSRLGMDLMDSPPTDRAISTGLYVIPFDHSTATCIPR